MDSVTCMMETYFGEASNIMHVKEQTEDWTDNHKDERASADDIKQMAFFYVPSHRW